MGTYQENYRETMKSVIEHMGRHVAKMVVIRYLHGDLTEQEAQGELRYQFEKLSKALKLNG